MDRTLIRYPLSHPQKRVWYNEKIYANSALNNIGGIVKIKGRVHLDLLEQAIHLFIRKNEGLRLQMLEHEGEPMQYVQAYTEEPLRFLDFSNGEDPSSESETWIDQEFRKPFQLEGGRLFDFALLKISDSINAYFVKFHHIVSDGWTILIMTEQIREFYQQLIKGVPVSDEVTFTYIDYLRTEEKYLASPRFTKNKAYWNRKFQALPSEFLMKSSDSIEGKRKRYYLDEERSQSVLAFVEQQKISLNTLFTALMFLYLHKVHQQSDIIVGIPVLNRSGFAEKQMVGMFTSTMPLRLSVDTAQSVTSFLHNINEELKSSFFHQRYPYNLLVEDLKLTQQGYDSLFQYCVNYYNTKLHTDMDGASLENVEYYNGSQSYTLQLVIKEWTTGKLELQFDYKTVDFTDEQMERVYHDFLTLLEQVMADLEQPIHQVQLLSEAERHHVLFELNQTDVAYPQGQTIQELFAEQVQRTPERVAVEFAGTSLTYQELNQRSNQLARLMQAKGVGRGQFVGIMATHSIEVVVAILAVIKTGAAYLPIDPDYPLDRIRYILNDSQVSFLLTNSNPPVELGFSGEVIELLNERLYTGAGGDLDVSGSPHDPVYVIYTSGSTGHPKGAVIVQQGLVNYIWWAKKTYVSGDDDVFALYSSIAFDLTVTSIFTPLIAGLKVAIYKDSGKEFLLHTILREKKATVIKLTPAHLTLLKELDNRDAVVRRFIVGGEDMKVRLAEDIRRSFGGAIEIFNEYGPTETVVGCMIHKYDPAMDQRASVSIGSAIDNVQIYLLDANLQPVPIGVTGELYISGDGVAQGYLHRPELTAERFLPNPFRTGKRMYKSGDLAVCLPNGKFEYLGRIDSQVKIKGYRIELGEIESRLLQHKAVHDAVVIDRQDANGAYLAAYVVAKRPVSPFEIRQFLAQELPNYMVPPYVVLLNELPLSPNGKVERKTLPDPLTISTDEVEWQTGDQAVEAALLQIVQEVLRVEQVGPGDNFFFMGGDSVKAIQIVARLSQIGWSLRVKDILNYPVMRELAATIETRQSSVAPQTPAEGMVLQTPIMRWFFAQNFANPHHWNQSVLLELKQDVPLAMLQDMLDMLVQRHDMLRLRMNEAEPCFNYDAEWLTSSLPMEVYDFSQATDPLGLMEEAGAAIKAGFQLTKGRLFHAALFRLGERGSRLLLTAHHLIVDAISWRILLEDGGRYLFDRLQGRTPVLPPKTHSFQAWAEALVAYAEGPALAEAAYWQERSVWAENAFPPDDALMGDRTGTASLELVFSSDETEKLLKEANVPYRTQTIELLLAALAASMSEWLGTSQVHLELEGHGRESLFDDLDIARTVGWFTTLYPLTLQNSDDLSVLIRSVKEEVRQTPNKGIGYGLLAYVAECVPKSLGDRVRFNYLGEIDNSLNNDLFAVALEASGAEQAAVNRLTTPLELVAMVSEQQLRMQVTFDAGRLQRQTVQRMLETFRQQTMKLIEHCCQKDDVEFTSADFDTVTLSQADLDFLFD